MHLQYFIDGAGVASVMQMYRRYSYERGQYDVRVVHEAEIQEGYVCWDGGHAIGCVYLCHRSLPEYNKFDIRTIDGYNFIAERYGKNTAYRVARVALRTMLRHVSQELYTFAAPGREEIISLVRPFGFREVGVNASGVLLRREVRR